jgi:hypothetical protein
VAFGPKHMSRSERGVTAESNFDLRREPAEPVSPAYSSPPRRSSMLKIRLSMIIPSRTLLIIPNNIHLSTTSGSDSIRVKMDKITRVFGLSARANTVPSPMPIRYLPSEAASWTRAQRRTWSINC